jgi:hypothetical protein
MRGTMLFFNERKHLGLIQSEDGERLQVSRDGFLPGQAPVGRCAGLPVDFDVSEIEQERWAVGVSVVEQVAPRRARRRSRG